MALEEKGGLMAYTESQLNLFNHKFGIKSGKQLNEKYSQSLENYLKEEGKYFEELQRREEEENQLH